MAGTTSGLPKVIVSVEIPPAMMESGLKALLSVGAMLGALHVSTSTSPSSVTSPFNAKALPFVSALSVMLSRR